MPDYPTVPPGHWEEAREMRRTPTSAEEVFWKAVSKKRLGVSFRRQHPIGPYIVDFACIEYNLIIEIDGEIHSEVEQVEYDKARESYLSSRGFRVKRVPNAAILNHLDQVLSDIRSILESHSR